MNVQYGCGLCAPEGWVNFDASPTLRLQRLPLLASLFRRWISPRFPDNVRYGDIVQGLPVPRESCGALYCSHILEHLALEDLRTALRNTFDCLQSDGLFRLVVPDLRVLARDYVNSHEPNAAETFIRATMLGTESRPRNLAGRLRRSLGNAQHLWMWDYEGLEKELRAAGFSRVRAAKWHDSEDPVFREVEEPARWERAVGIECRK